MALEALPICLEKSLPSWLAILLSTVAVVIVSEIVP